MTRHQLVALHVLRREGGIGRSRLADATGREDRPVQATLNTLLAAGLVVSESNGRYTTYLITDAGRAALDTAGVEA